MHRVVLAIDPGRFKCGVAVVEKTPGGNRGILYKSVVEANGIIAVVKDIASSYSPDIILIGDGTSGTATFKSIESLQIASVKLVDEKYTSQLARGRYFEENPPRGLRRLIPTSLQTPPCPIDDYVAVILAERYLEENNPH